EDNCDASVTCPGCDGGQTCNAGTCSGCIPDPNPCGSQPCGFVTNNCGQRIFCGNNGACVTPGQVCLSNNTCCTPDNSQCGSTFACGGSFTNNCGQSITCPGCSASQLCFQGSCCNPVSCPPGSCYSTTSCGTTVSCGCS